MQNIFIALRRRSVSFPFRMLARFYSALREKFR